MIAAVETLAPDVGTRAACEAIGVPRASLYRRRKPASATASEKQRKASPRALSEPERQEVLDTLHSERFRDQAPLEVYATLLDEGRYLCSPRTMYRILDDNEEIKERRDQLRHPAYTKPELLATAPNHL